MPYLSRPDVTVQPPRRDRDRQAGVQGVEIRGTPLRETRQDRPVAGFDGSISVCGWTTGNHFDASCVTLVTPRPI